MPPDLMVAVRGPSLVSEGSIEEKRKGERRDKREVRRKERKAVNNFLQGAHNLNLCHSGVKSHPIFNLVHYRFAADIGCNNFNQFYENQLTSLG